MPVSGGEHMGDTSSQAPPLKQVDIASTTGQKELTSLSLAELRSRLQAPATGLSQTEAKGRLAQYGFNELPEEKVNPILRSEEHTSELQSLRHLVCRLLLEK